MTSSGGIIRGIESWPEYGLAKTLVKKGHNVTIFSSSSALKKHEGLKNETVEGINVKRFNPIFPSSLFGVLKEDFDVLHMHHLGYLAPISSYAALGKKIKSVPSVFTMHGIYHNPYIVTNIDDPLSGRINNKVRLSFPFLRPWQLANWFVHLPLQADKITALTEWEKTAISKLGIDSRKIDVVPNGVDLEKYNAGKTDYFKKLGIKGKILLFVGQPTQRKGWKYFLDAMPRILKGFPDAKAVFIGYSQNKELEDYSKSLGLDKSVVFLGYLPEENKIDAFKSADVFVFPTLYEGFGIVFLEAMASSLPIVTTDSAGNKEIVENNKNGLLIKTKNSLEIAEAVIKLLENKTLRAKISKANKRKVLDYEWKKVTEKYLEIYEDVKK